MLHSKNIYSRKLSSSERLYLAGKDLFPSFCIQIMLESKDNIDIDLLQNAVNVASDVHPSSRLILAGKRQRSYWVDSGKNPKVEKIQNPQENEHGFDFEAFNIFSEKIDFINGPTSRLYHISGQKNRVLFQVFHGTMDAQGALLWAKDIFRVLQDKEPLGAQNNLTDQEFLSTIKKKEFRKNYPLDCPSFLTQQIPKQEGFVWSRVVINHRINGIVSKLAKAIADQMPGQKNRFMIPVDMRRHTPKEQIGGNFSNPLFFEVSKQDTWEVIYEKMVRALAYNKELITGKTDGILNYLPLWLLKKAFKTIFKKEVSNNKFMLTSVISNIGRIEKDWFSCKGYQPDSVCFLPVNIPIAAMSFVITENEEHMELTVTAPASMTTKKGLDTALTELAKTITNQEKKTAPIKGENILIPNEKNILHLIADQCNSNPNSVAIDDGKQRITYQVLAQKSNTIAKEITKKLNPKEAIIAVKMNRSIDYISTLIAIMKVGATFLPIDPEYPKARIEYILDDANVDLMISDVPSKIHKAAVIDISNIEYNDHKEFESLSIASEIAYIIYTSGSTGNPKGVKISGANFMNYIYWAKKEYAAQKKISFPFFTSISFDLTITSIFLPLVTGGIIKVYSKAFQNNILHKILKDKELNAIKLTPTHLRLLEVSGIIESTIKNIIVGGEDLSCAISQSIDTQFDGQVTIYNEYGPTEATVGCIVHKFDPKKDTTSSVPIGLPIANTSIYILNESLKMVADGAIGEVYIAGDSVAIGYLNKLEMTQQKFITNPFKKDTILYKTGDLGQLLSDGNILYKGRTDDQVKIRGHRIELAEIEHCIRNHSKVKQALVTIIKSTSDEAKMVIGYYVGQDLENEDLRQYLANNLPKYMIPSHLFSLDQIPLNANGKVDKEKLPKPTDFYKTVDADTENFNEIELKIRDLFADILEIDSKHIARNSDFYAIGGDSLGVTILVSTIMTELIPSNHHEEWLGITRHLVAEPTITVISDMIKKILSK